MHVWRNRTVFRAATPQEITIQGLMTTSLPNVQVKNIPGKGRGIFLEEAVEEGTFLLEYKSKEVYPRKQRKEKEEEYAHYLAGVKIVTGTYLSWRTHINHLHRQ